MTAANKYLDYLTQIRMPYIKLCRLRFLNPDGSTAFAIDNNPKTRRNKAFLRDSGEMTCNLQNGRRRSMSVTLAQISDEFFYNVNELWFGTEVDWDEGLILSDGTPFYIRQGRFVIETPEEIVGNAQREITLNLVDKWANLDGSLLGNLEGTYAAEPGFNIFSGIAALLREDRGNGRLLDNVTPVFTSYYNGKTQTLPDGTVVSITDTPHSIDVTPGTKADVVLAFAEMLNAWVGYDPTGALRIDPSQDDISDATKPVEWVFREDEAEIIGLTYQIKNTEVYNDVIVVGQDLDDQPQPAARAQNRDLRSDTNVQTIGLKTLRIDGTQYFTVQQCMDYAEWKLKRISVLQKAVTIQCKQMFHIQPNQIVSVVRTDKPGKPIERHLVMGFSRPIDGTQPMTINCVSVNDYPDITVSQWGTDDTTT